VKTQLEVMMRLAKPKQMMREGFVLFTVFFIPWVSAESTGDGVFEGLQVEMSADEQRATGVGGLSETELDTLNQWLRERFNQMQETVSAEVRASDAMEREAEIERRVAVEVEAQTKSAVSEKTLDDEFEAEIVSPFSGWSGGAVFKLSNGQTWRQRNTSVYHHRGADTRVRLVRGYFGLWRMVVLSSGVSVSVSLVP
jgi:hypothetical protein